MQRFDPFGFRDGRNVPILGTTLDGMNAMRPSVPDTRPFARASALALLLAALSGCSHISGLGGSSEFKCHAPEGVPCMSVSGVAANDAAGTLPGARASVEGASARARVQRYDPSAAPDAGARLQPVVLTPTRPDGPSVRVLGAIRSEPTVIRIWVAPWEDADGDLNDQGYVYLQIDAGRWLIEHNRERIRREFAPKPAQVAAASAQKPAAPSVGAAPAPGAPAALQPPRPVAGAGMTTAYQPK